MATILLFLFDARRFAVIMLFRGMTIKRLRYHPLAVSESRSWPSTKDVTYLVSRGGGKKLVTMCYMKGCGFENVTSHQM